MAAELRPPVAGIRSEPAFAAGEYVLTADYAYRAAVYCHSAKMLAHLVQRQFNMAERSLARQTLYYDAFDTYGIATATAKTSHRGGLFSTKSADGGRNPPMVDEIASR